MDKQTKQTRTVFIINPMSGNGEGMKTMQLIESVMKKLGLSYEFMVTEYPMHAQQIARSYRQSDNVRLIGVGGDGTINEILNGINVGVPFGIIPSGSGNDFFRMISSNKIDLRQLILDTVHGEVKMVDYGIMNGRKFLNSCSIGFDAQINKEARDLQSKSKVQLKGGSYMAAALKAILRPVSIHATLEMADTTIRKDMLLISAMNGRWYGNGFCPAPKASITDGLLEVSVIDFLTTIKILPLFPKYMKGNHVGAKAITTYRVNRFTLHTDQPAYVQVDGETFTDTRFEIEVVHKGLSLLVPKGNTYNHSW